MTLSSGAGRAVALAYAGAPSAHNSNKGGYVEENKTMRWVIVENKAHEYNRGITITSNVNGVEIHYGTHYIFPPYNLTMKETIALIGGGWVYEGGSLYYIYPLTHKEIADILTR